MIHLRCDRSSTSAEHLYRVAGVSLRADRPLAWLSAFGTTQDPSVGPTQEFETGTIQADQTGVEASGLEGGTPAILPSLPRGVEGGTPSVLSPILPSPRGVEGGTPSVRDPSSLPDAPGDVLFAGRAHLARRERNLICRRLPATFRLEVEALGLFEYHPAESLIEVAAADPAAPPELLEEVLLGPLLALALARRDIFLLHASGCEIGGNAYLFLGESGAGKSTLAARLAALGGLLLADDQAAIGAVRLELLPDFPQPKLDPARQKPLAGAPARPIAGIFLLAAAPAEAEPAIEDLSPLEAAAGLLRHTTAARCFDHPLLRAHLDFAAALAGRVPCRRLHYPHNEDAPKKIGALLAP